MLYGRLGEQERVRALLEAARDRRSGALLVVGEPGAGKSALLDEARAEASDMAALEARGVESESRLPYASLYQLLRPALGALERIPRAQAAARPRAARPGHRHRRRYWLPTWLPRPDRYGQFALPGGTYPRVGRGKGWK